MTNEPPPETTFSQLQDYDHEVVNYAYYLYPRWYQNPKETWEQVKTRLEPPLETTYEDMTRDQKTYCRQRVMHDTEMTKDYSNESNRHLPWGEFQVPDDTTYNQLKRKPVEVQKFLFGKYDKWYQTPDMTLAEMRLLSNPTLTYEQLFSDPRYSEKISQILYNQYPTWPDTPHKTLKQMREEAPLRGREEAPLRGREEAPLHGLVRKNATIYYPPDDDF